MLDVEWPAGFTRGVAMFNAREYFETHEVWEDVWRTAPPAERDFYQGMIHLTVALYQAGRANWRAAYSQLRRAQRRLAAFEPAYRGLALRALRESAAAVVAQLEAGGSQSALPRISLPAAASRESPPDPAQSGLPAQKRPK